MRGHKRVHRIYCELELTLHIKPKKRLKRDKPEPLGPECQCRSQLTPIRASPAASNSRSRQSGSL